MPANRVGFLSHDVRVVHHVLAHFAAPIRLRFCAHGINGDRAEMVLGLVLLDIVVKCELRAAHRRLLVKSIGSSRQNNTSC